MDVRVALIVTYQPLTHFTKNTQKYNLLTLLLLLLFSRSVGLLVGSLREPENLNWAPHSTNFGFIFFSVWWKKQRKYKKIECQTETDKTHFISKFIWLILTQTHTQMEIIQRNCLMICVRRIFSSKPKQTKAETVYFFPRILLLKRRRRRRKRLKTLELMLIRFAHTKSNRFIKC